MTFWDIIEETKKAFSGLLQRLPAALEKRRSRLTFQISLSVLNVELMLRERLLFSRNLAVRSYPMILTNSGWKVVTCYASTRLLINGSKQLQGSGCHLAGAELQIASHCVKHQDIMNIELVVVGS